MALLLPNSRWSLVALLSFSIAGSASALAIISKNYYALSQSSMRAKNTIIALSDLEGSLKDAETGQNGYLLTGNSDYLKPYLIGAGIAQFNIDKLNSLIEQNDTISTKASEEISNLTKLQLKELAKTVEKRRTEGLDAALPLVQSNAGKTYMDVIHQRSNRIRLVQEATLGTNATILSQLDNFRNGLLFFIVVCSIGIFWLLLQSFREELKLRKEIANAQESELVTKEEAVKKLKIVADLKERELSLRIHDWKSPVSSIQSSVELIKYYYSKELLTRDNFIKHYDRINTSIDTLVNGFNDALLVAKAEAGRLDIQRQHCDLVAIAQNSINAVESKAPNHQLKLYPREPTHLVTCDVNLVQRALINLLENAIKHTSSGEIAIELSKANGDTCIQVADQGDGIPAKDLQRLFSAFERGATEASGTGLGLAVVRHCAEAHDGMVTVRSEQGLRLNHPDSLLYNTVFTFSI